MTKTAKLELTWVGKENRPRLEPRILLEDATKSFHANARVSANDVFDNRLILGDNLLALKALEQELSGRVKCVYIDPPYNTGAALSHYDDSVEHSTWLSLIRERLEILWRLLSPDGSLWVSIDDYEVAYLRVLMDEVCGRSNFIATNVWQKRYSRENREAIGDVHEYILVYAKTPERFKAIRNRVPITEEQAKIYKNPNNDPKGRWRGIPMTAQGYRPNQMYPISTPTGVVHRPPEGRCWSTIEPEFEKLRRDRRIWFGKDGSSQPSVIRYLSEVEGMVPWTWWPSDEVGHTDEAKKEIHELFGRADAFETPKPERLIERIIRIASNPGDLILDSFAGSGTTGAVAHKLHRRWIMVEVREQGQNLIVRRLKKVVEGKDQGGISGSIGWKGGGGFRCYNLAPSLLEKDRFGNWIISQRYNGAMLAEAMCKFEGFKYSPSDTEYWMHGHSTERDFIYVTTQTLTREQLHKLGDEVGESRSLLVCCSAFRVRDTSQFPNLTIKKIPKMVLNRCEWGRDDYSLEIKNLPQAAEPEPPTSSPVNGRKQRKNGSMDLFAAVSEKGVSGK